MRIDIVLDPNLTNWGLMNQDLKQEENTEYLVINSSRIKEESISASQRSSLLTPIQNHKNIGISTKIERVGSHKTSNYGRRLKEDSDFS
mmetsp:Transcript_27033/g.23861  ORF Transcript_27033/g.23861 Transcript_27033/m.23861 type:complete len:89 (+) Transcript_27033:231-497(+)